MIEGTQVSELFYYAHSYTGSIPSVNSVPMLTIPNILHAKETTGRQRVISWLGRMTRVTEAA